MAKCFMCDSEIIKAYGEDGDLCSAKCRDYDPMAGLEVGMEAAHEEIAKIANSPRFRETDDHLFDTALHGPYSA